MPLTKLMHEYYSCALALFTNDPGTAVGLIMILVVVTQRRRLSDILCFDT